MQKAILTFEDTEDNTLQMSVVFEPEITDDTRSYAAIAAIKCMDFIASKSINKQEEGLDYLQED